LTCRVNPVNVYPVNRKQTVAARLPDDVLLRLERLAQTDRRTLSNTVLLAIEHGLPVLEAEVLGSAAKPAKKRHEVGA